MSPPGRRCLVRSPLPLEINGTRHPFAEWHCLNPTEQLGRACDVRLTHLGVIGWQGLIHDLAGAFCDLKHHFSQFCQRVLVGVAYVHRLVDAVTGEAKEAFDEVVDVAERPRLLAVA